MAASFLPIRCLIKCLNHFSNVGVPPPMLFLLIFIFLLCFFLCIIDPFEYSSMFAHIYIYVKKLSAILQWIPIEGLVQLSGFCGLVSSRGRTMRFPLSRRPSSFRSWSKGKLQPVDIFTKSLLPARFTQLFKPQVCNMIN